MSLPLRRKTAGFLRRTPWLMALSYSVVRIFQPRHTVGVVGAVFNEKQQVLLVEHVFHPKHPWGLPGGWVERKEHLSDAIQREFLEELTLTVEVAAIACVETTHRNHLDVAYLCQMKSDIGSLSYELLSYDWFDLNHLPHVNRFTYKAIKQAYLLLDVLESEKWQQI